MIRKHIVAKGRVQSVGFRYFCTSIASKCNVTGWVRNLYDGSVEIEVQGADHRVDLFIQEVNAGNRFARVDRLDITNIPPIKAGEETHFQVKR